MLCDDLWHPAEVIERGIRGLGDGAHSFDVVKSAKDILTPKRLEQYDAVIIAKSNNVNAANTAPWFEESVTEVGPEEFRAYLERGGGIVFVHSGTCIGERFLGDADERFKKPARGMQALHGCTMNGHPLRCDCDIYVTDPDSPLAEGVGAFTVHDEHYQISDLAGDAQVFLQWDSAPGGTQPAGWTREIYGGRIVVLTPGHTLDVWENPEFRKLLVNAIEWTTCRT
mgnify:FL=1